MFWIEKSTRIVTNIKKRVTLILKKNYSFVVITSLPCFISFMAISLSANSFSLPDLCLCD